MNWVLLTALTMELAVILQNTLLIFQTTVIYRTGTMLSIT